MPAKSSGAIKVFFSYAHEDELLRNELAKQLSLLKRTGQIEDWHDRRIIAGADWSSAINEHLDAADIILLLISPDFFDSDYCYSIELRRALERHEAGEARVIPVILRAVVWEDAPFRNLQVLPTDARPVTSWTNRDEAFKDIVQGIRAAVRALRPAAPELPDQGRFQVPPLLPYMCDRSDQELELAPALRRHQTETPRRPFLCVVHGDQDECHSEFLERLQHDTIPRFLKLKARSILVEHYTLPWPSQIRSGGTTAASAFHALLGHTILGDGAASTEEIFDVIPPERPVMIVLRLKTEDLAGGGLSALSAFFDFWNAWPDLPVGRALVCVVSVRHQRLDKFGFFDRRRLKKTHEEARRFINALGSGRHAGLGGIVLPELRAITHHDVIVWSQKREVRELCHISEQAIDSLFARRDLRTRGGHISMQALADELENLVLRYRH